MDYFENMIITLSGTPGSGKSTIAQNLETLLPAERIYAGGIRREMARKKGMTLEELNEYGKNHPETDIDVDKEVAAKARYLDQQGKQVIVEGRTQYHFIPESIKIFIKVDPEEGARRIWKDLQRQDTRQQRNEGNIRTFDEMKRSIQEREESDVQRYQKYYGIDHRIETQYDLVVDTTHLTPELATQQILTYLKTKQKSL